MPVHSTAAVTARDRLVIGWNYDELCDRLQRFGDLSIDDEVIRQDFGASRSTLYRRGDTRGWRLAEARRRMAETTDWRQYIEPCLYRPYDERPVIWTDWMIDWPRLDVMRHLRGDGNLAIVARRQMLPTQPCTFFWVTNRIAIDGLIRSDNRGSESIFPLYLISQSGSRTANFSQSLVDAFQKILSWQWKEEGRGDLIHTFGPEDLLYYIYALFHSNSYRSCFQAELRIDFPRILLANAPDLFRSLSHTGRELVRLHLLQDIPGPGLLPVHHGVKPTRLGPSYPQRHEDRIYLSEDSYLESVSDEVWSFRVGGYQVCRKWLRDRRQRELHNSDWQHYGRIIGSVRETIELMHRIDTQIAAAGGWDGGFALPRTLKT
jgi:hypothetical protein